MSLIAATLCGCRSRWECRSYWIGKYPVEAVGTLDVKYKYNHLRGLRGPPEPSSTMFSALQINRSQEDPESVKFHPAVGARMYVHDGHSG